MVTHTGGRRYGHAAHEGGGMSAHAIATGLRSFTSAEWDTATLGHMGLAWLPSPPSSAAATPEKKLAHLVELADQRLQSMSGGFWRLRLDHDDCPRAILLTRANAVAEIMHLRWDGRLLKLDGAIFSMATPEVAQAVLASVASRVGARLGSH